MMKQSSSRVDKFLSQKIDLQATSSTPLIWESINLSSVPCQMDLYRFNFV